MKPTLPSIVRHFFLCLILVSKSHAQKINEYSEFPDSMFKIMFEHYYDKDLIKAAIELGNELLEKPIKKKNYYTKGGTYSLR
jgi:aromatic ring-opening dioxygenase catalytic subunit (LigB family)